MPIYEYECEQCGKIEEVLQKITDAPPKGCSNCSGKLHKLMSRNSFHLKGSGWYVTDYAGKSPNSSSTTSKDEASAKSSDTKSADSTS